MPAPLPAFMGCILEGVSDPIPANDFIETPHKTYRVDQVSRLWVLSVDITEGDLYTLVNDPGSGLEVKTMFALDADDPEHDDSGELFDIEPWRIKFPLSYFCQPGQLDLWFKLTNTTIGGFPALFGNIGFNFYIMADQSG